MANEINTVKTFPDDLHTIHAKTAENSSQRNATLLLQLCPYMQSIDITRTRSTYSARLARFKTQASNDIC